ncbi:trimeric intracellular cation channel family protein [Dyella lutea]
MVAWTHGLSGSGGSVLPGTRLQKSKTRPDVARQEPLACAASPSSCSAEFACRPRHCSCSSRTGIGGGMVRDLLLADVPMVLRADLYAVATLSGAVAMVIGAWLVWPVVPTIAVAALACFVLRMLAVRRGWRAAAARGLSSTSVTWMWQCHRPEPFPSESMYGSPA